jgi:hypothetical protein
MTARKSLVVLCSLLLLGVIGVGAGLLGGLLLGNFWSVASRPGPFPDNDPAGEVETRGDATARVDPSPDSDPAEESDANGDATERIDLVAHNEPAEEKDPTYGIPLEIIIEGVPEVPAELLGPSPPIEEEQKQEGE